MIPAFWAGYILTHPAWLAIAAACAIAFTILAAVTHAENKRDDGAHAAVAGPAVVSRRPRPWQPRTVLVSVPERHHEWLTAGDSPAGITKIAGYGGSPDQAVNFAGGLRLPDVPGRDGASSAVRGSARRGPVALAENRHLPATAPAGDQAPGPRLPEGDTHTAWPPQEAGPGDLPPMSDLLASALRELEDAERWPWLAPGAGYSNGRPFTDYLRDSVVMPAIRGL